MIHKESIISIYPKKQIGDNQWTITEVGTLNSGDPADHAYDYKVVYPTVELIGSSNAGKINWPPTHENNWVGTIALNIGHNVRLMLSPNYFYKLITALTIFQTRILDEHIKRILRDELQDYYGTEDNEVGTDTGHEER